MGDALRKLMRSETTELPSQFCSCFAISISVLCSLLMIKFLSFSASFVCIWRFPDFCLSSSCQAFEVFQWDSDSASDLLTEPDSLWAVQARIQTHFSVINLEICYKKNLYITGIVTSYGP